LADQEAEGRIEWNKIPPYMLFVTVLGVKSSLKANLNCGL